MLLFDRTLSLLLLIPSLVRYLSGLNSEDDRTAPPSLLTRLTLVTLKRLFSTLFSIKFTFLSSLRPLTLWVTLSWLMSTSSPRPDRLRVNSTRNKSPSKTLSCFLLEASLKR
uniref:Secreted protein n=1 Tax=Cacopsylla melanoneura TaxID=428564 RepID=A0A8D9F169_9HEMI